MKIGFGIKKNFFLIINYIMTKMAKKDKMAKWSNDHSDQMTKTILANNDFHIKKYQMM